VTSEAFERDGFVVIEGFVSAAECDALVARADELIASFLASPEARSIFSTREQMRTSDEYFLESGDKIRFFLEEDGKAVNKIGHALHDLDPVFAAFSHTPELARAAAEVAGMGDPRVLQSMYIVKGPRVGGEVSLHTDHTFLWTEPQSATGFWFALEDATLENGCLWALPGGHRLPARRRFRRDGAGGTTFDELDLEPYPTEGEVPLPATKGTLVVLHGLLPHRSDANRSERSRAAYTLHCIDAAAEYPADNWLQRSPALPLRGFGTPRPVVGAAPA
jgi:phytanoyl-CoA hydroxylase